MKQPIPTAEEFINSNIKVNEYPLLMDKAKLLMVEFAKLHVKAALEAASNKKSYGMLVRPLFDEYECEAILTAYPESNIK